MIYKRVLLVAATSVILTVAWLATAHPVLGCVCGGRTVKEYTADADVVFSATVVEHIDSLGYPYQEDLPPVYRLSIDSVWKGSIAPIVDISAALRSDCDFSFIVGRRYLVFATWRDDVGLYAHKCTGTTEWGVFSSEDTISEYPTDFMSALAFLGEAHPPDPLAAVATLVPTPRPLTMPTVEAWQTRVATDVGPVTQTSPASTVMPPVKADADVPSSAADRSLRLTWLAAAVVVAAVGTLVAWLSRKIRKE